MSGPTTKFILMKWLRQRLDNGIDIVKSHEIETSLVEYGKEYWGCLYTPSTYSRVWRDLKSGTELDDIDVSGIEVINTKSAENTWRLKTGT